MTISIPFTGQILVKPIRMRGNAEIEITAVNSALSMSTVTAEIEIIADPVVAGGGGFSSGFSGGFSGGADYNSGAFSTGFSTGFK